jgi:hypothetical protein
LQPDGGHCGSGLPLAIMGALLVGANWVEVV